MRLVELVELVELVRAEATETKNPLPLAHSVQQ